MQTTEEEINIVEKEINEIEASTNLRNRKIAWINNQPSALAETRRRLFSTSFDNFVCLEDFEAAAKLSFNRPAYDFVSGGANSMSTVKENIQSYERVKLLGRVMINVSEVDTSVSLLGSAFKSPIGIAPTGLLGVSGAGADTAVASAAAATKSLFCASSMCNEPLADIYNCSPLVPKWFQLYVLRDRERTRRLVRQVEELGYNAIVLTADAPRLGRRERDLQNNFRLPPGVGFPNLDKLFDEEVDNNKPGTNYMDYVSLFDDSFTWDIIDFLKLHTKLPIIVKGVLNPLDAAMASIYGVDGIWVSNHGGRQLDTVPSALECLPGILEAVKDRQCEIYADGGIRRGTDVIKALAMGAKAVFVGRPIVWGMGVGGQPGVEHVLRLLNDELKLAMALSGCRTLEEIDKNVLFHQSKNL